MILDTNALSALAAREEGLIRALDRPARLCVTLISLGEYHYGMRRSKRRIELERWLEALLRRVEVLSPSPGTLPHYADLRVELRAAGTPIPANDVWIAALARQHRLPLASSDRHFDHVAGLKRIGW